MLHGPVQIHHRPAASTDAVVVFAVDLVVDRGDAPRVAVRAPAGCTVDVVNVEEGAPRADGHRAVTFVVEADRGDTAFDVRVIVALGEHEETLAGPAVAARPAP